MSLMKHILKAAVPIPKIEACERFLFVGPHPDDIEIGAGATVGCRPEDAQDKDAWGVAVIGEGVHIAPGVAVPAKALVDQDIKGE